MPRPKKPGAPEPKKRSRNGCHPCKERKVKCDERHPVCENCARQPGLICDYTLKLKWNGRGRQDGTTNPGQVNFTSGVMSATPSRPSTGDSAATSNSGQLQFQSATFAVQPQGPSLAIPRSDNTLTSQQNLQYTPELAAAAVPRSFASGMSMIDPALAFNPPTPTHNNSLPASIYRDGLYGGRADSQYTSFERYQSTTPTDTNSAPESAVSRLRVQGLENPHSSFGDSAMISPSTSAHANRGFIMDDADSSISTPPFYGNGKDDEHSLDLSGSDRPTKRSRYQATQDVSSPSYHSTMPPPYMTGYSSFAADPQVMNSGIAQPSSLVGTPLTPSSSHSDEGYKNLPSKASPHASQENPDARRLSVSSLLSGPSDVPYSNERAYNRQIISGVHDWSSLRRNVFQDTTTWGVDRGFKDLDIGKNDDMNAISGSSPVAMRDHLELVLDEDGEFVPIEFGFGYGNDKSTAFESGEYYSKPVPISIPRALEPLPEKLLENPMNLLYFHHFLNHTAGCLIPHNCSSNPFKMLLPQMAVRDENLMALLLAYSASHRARLLRQPEPATRIALWVQAIFPNLRRALDDPSEIISNANLATAIMLASLEIISPKAFGVEVPWQNHLDTARQMIAARGGPQGMETASRDDKVSSFLWSWFAFLDIIGSLSGGRTHASSSAWILDYEIEEEKEYEIDCILGFTGRCVRILAKIAELSRICDGQRIGSDHTILSDWQPSEDIITRAGKLERDLAASIEHPARPCTHMTASGEAAYQWDSIEMAATNEAFHLAGLVHLHRRILGKPSTHEDVQHAVRKIFGALYKVRKGSSAEACLLFPMFTAGCEIQDEKQRADILDRIKSIERFGMTQIHKARTLMERVWETGKPWETLVAGEFFG